MLRKTASGWIGLPARTRRYRDPLLLARKWNVIRFLASGGTVLVILGVTGVRGWLGSLSGMELFHPPYWVNWLHLGFGAFVWAVVLLGRTRLQQGLAFFGALAGTVLGLGNLALHLHGMSQGAAPPRDLSDPLTHLTGGLLAIVALLNNQGGDHEEPKYPSAHS